MSEKASTGDTYFPARPLVDFSTSRWSLPLAHRLLTARAPLRFRDLQRDIPGISAQELTRMLRRFEHQQLVTRHETFEPVHRIVYRPTEVLAHVSASVNAMADWARLVADALSAGASQRA